MKHWILVTALAALPLAANADAAKEGVMLASADGARIGTVYRVTGDGSAQVIVNGKIVTVPSSSLSTVDGRLVTSLKKDEVKKLR